MLETVDQSFEVKPEANKDGIGIVFFNNKQFGTGDGFDTTNKTLFPTGV